MMNIIEIVKSLRIIALSAIIFRILLFDMKFLFINLFTPDFTDMEKIMKIASNDMTDSQKSALKGILKLDLNINSIIETKESLRISYVNYKDTLFIESIIGSIQKRIAL